jgi:uncharacterized protein
MTTLSTPLPLSDAGPVHVPEATAALKPARRGWHIASKVTLSLFCFIIIAITGLHAYIAYRLAHPYVAPLVSNPKIAAGLDYSEVTFPANDQDTLIDGWWIPASESHKTIVLSHGYGTNREEPWVPMYELSALIHARGYNVLMFDYGYASSKHRMPATGGVLESGQLLGALQFARQHGSDELIVWGFSMGAGTALQAALRSEPVDAMILDSTFLPDDYTLYYNIRQQIDVPKYPSLSLLRTFIPIMSGASLSDIPSKQVEQTNYDFPILLIHGTADDKAPEAIAERIAHAQLNPLSELWVVPDALHEMIYRMHPEEYIARTTAFLDQIDSQAALKQL